MGEEVTKERNSKIPAGLGAFIGGSVGATSLGGARDIIFGSLADEIAKDIGPKMGINLGDDAGKVMKRVGAGKIAIPAVVGALIANKIYKGKGDKDMEDKQAYLSSQDLEKLAQENPELAEEVSLELLNKIAGIIPDKEVREHAKKIRGANAEEIAKLPMSKRQLAAKMTAQNPNLRDFFEGEVEESFIENPRMGEVAEGYKKDNRAMLTGFSGGGIGGTLAGLGAGTLLADAILKKNPKGIKQVLAVAAPTIGVLGGAIGGATGGVRLGGAIGSKHLEGISEEEAKQLASIENDAVRKILEGSLQGGYMKADPKPMQREASIVDKDILEKIASKDMDLAEEISRMILEKEASNLPMKIVDETKGLSEADKKKIAKIIAAAGGTAMAAGIGAKATKAVKNKKKKDDEEKAASVIDKDILEKIAKEDKDLAEEISKMILEKSAKEKMETKEIEKEPKKDNPGEKLVEKEQKEMKPEKAAEEAEEKQEKKASELTQEDLKKIKDILSK